MKVGFHSELDRRGEAAKNIELEHGGAQAPHCFLAHCCSAIPPMNRYTAIRPSMILAAVAKPLVIMAIYLLLASKVDSGYLLLLIALLVFVIILPALCVDPVVEDEETRRRPDHGVAVRR